MASISPLRRRMIDDMTIRNLSPVTQRSYLHAVSKFSQCCGQSPDRLGLDDVRDFQVHLVAKGVSWGSLNQIVCSLRFFYGVTPRKDAFRRSRAGARLSRTLHPSCRHRQLPPRLPRRRSCQLHLEGLSRWWCVQSDATEGAQGFPPFTTVHYYFYLLRGSGLLDILNEAWVGASRALDGRDAVRTAGIVPSH